ncbi:hypothetical protein OS493_039316, partial [Desmophyllum pertusum]
MPAKPACATELPELKLHFVLGSFRVNRKHVSGVFNGVRWKATKSSKDRLIGNGQSCKQGTSVSGDGHVVFVSYHQKAVQSPSAEGRVRPYNNNGTEYINEHTIHG